MVVIMFLLVMAVLTILAIGELQAAIPYHSVLYQQNVTGKVTDPDGNALLGVTVRVAGENYGTTTNLDGEYNIVVNSGEKLIFSFVGYKPQEILIDEQSELNVSLEEDVDALKEVTINAGYYNTTRRESTGNISRVTASEIENQPVVSPLQALQGRMAGVEVISGGAYPGAAPTIRIRGINSLRTEGNYPLYIIDGVPIDSKPIESNSLIGNTGIDPLNNLDISNIQSIEVLKDADATAIYGSRGANGVVLITTKKGSAGTGLEASFYTGAAIIPNRLELLNTKEYLQVRRAAFENDEVEPTERNAYDLLLWDQNRDTDWQDYIFGGTSKTTSTSINFSGGNENTSFRIGGSYFTQGTIYPGEYDYHKITGNANMNHRSEDGKFNINLALNYGVDENNLVGNLRLSSAAFTIPPNAPAIFDEDGSLNWEDWGAAGLNNPFEGYFNSTDTRTNNLISNIAVSYEFLKGMRFKTSLGYNYLNSVELWKLPARSYNPASSLGNNSIHLNSDRRSWIIEPQLVFENNIKKLGIEAILGTTFQESTFEKENFQARGYVSETLIGNLSAAEDLINANSENLEYRYSAIFSRIGLNWDGTYFLNFTGRRDGSSRFGPKNRFANFGAIGTAWIFSEETFVQKSLPFISFGKLRGSYGTTGNDQIGDYGYLDAYEATRGAGGLYPITLANPDYSWEINKKLEAGLELGFVKDRLKLGVSWYKNRSSNQLVGYSLPAITGFTSVQANLPATVENTGWEMELSSLNLDRDNFNWRTSLNLSIPKNELISYPNLDQSSYANTYRVGSPLNISLRYQYEGVDPETGFYQVKDVNDDGRFDFEDQIIIHNQTREFYGGINNDLTYKNFSLQFLWQFVKQEGSRPLFSPGFPGAQLDDSLESLQGNPNFPRISQTFQASRAFGYASNSLFPIQDASFLRLKTLSLGYNIPATIIQKLGIKSCKLFMHGQNLLTITPYDGMDPEFSYSGISIGNLRSITGGLQINL